MTDKSTPSSSDDGRIYEVLAELTESIKQLAYGRPGPRERDETARLHQRVDFGYRALGALMGRTSTIDTDFDVATFAARREQRVIHLTGLPADVEVVSLHAPGETVDGEVQPEVHETVPVQRSSDLKHPLEARIEPVRIGPDRSIDSMIGLADEDGPLLAFGPRLSAVPTAHVG